MEIKPDRMISLGYGKYWRSDGIVGLMRIEEDRGPGRRTEVYTSTVDHPLVVSRGERAILQDMAVATDEGVRLQEVQEALSDLLVALGDVPDVLKRSLATEARMDVAAWQRRIRALQKTEVADALPDPQNELFG
jgi:hypothetical protein